MSEQKYYVKSLLEQNSKYDLWLDSVGTFDYSNLRKSYTKTELAEIMDGALYKQTHSFPFSGYYGSDESLSRQYNWSYNFEIKRWEWKNPLIELVPVEVE